MQQQAANELLCDCLAQELDGARLARLEQLSTADWESVIQQSLQHELILTLYQRLKTLKSEVNVPAHILKELQEIYFSCAGENMRLYHELSRVLNKLTQAGIPVIALKGAHLAQVVYGNPTLRQMNDVDLLVKEIHLPRVHEILLEIGYVFYEEGNQDLSNHHFHYELPDSSLRIVEMHSDILPPLAPFEVNVSELWERATPGKIAGMDILFLSIEDLLLHLCLHTAYIHLSSSNLKQYYDIAETVRHFQGELDWDLFESRAHQWNAAHCAYLALRLAKDLLTASIPDKVLATLDPGNAMVYLAWVKKQILTGEQVFLSDQASLSSIPFQSTNLVNFWQANRLKDKATILLKSAFPPPQVLAERYRFSPASRRLYLYYIINLKDMFFEHIPVIWKLLRQDKNAAKEKMRLTELRDRKIAMWKWLSSGDQIQES